MPKGGIKPQRFGNDPIEEGIVLGLRREPRLDAGVLGND
jgi:hypothetical protein